MCAIKIRFNPYNILGKPFSKLSCFIIVYRRQRTAPINISISRLRDGLSELIESRERI